MLQYRTNGHLIEIVEREGEDRIKSLRKVKECGILTKAQGSKEGKILVQRNLPLQERKNHELNR